MLRDTPREESATESATRLIEKQICLFSATGALASVSMAVKKERDSEVKERNGREDRTGIWRIQNLKCEPTLRRRNPEIYKNLREPA